MNNQFVLDSVNQLMECRNFQECVNLCCLIFESPVLVVDMNHNILAHSEMEVSNNPSWETIVIEKKLSRELFEDNIRLKAEDANTFQSGKALLVNAYGATAKMIKKGLICNENKVGMLMIIPDTKILTKEDTELADTLGNIIAFKMLSHEGMLFLKDTQKHTFFASLLDGTIYSTEQLDLWLSTTGFSRKNYLYIGICSTNTEKSIFSPELDLDLFADAVSGISFIYNHSLVLLFSVDNPIINPETELSQLESLLCEKQMQAGFSTFFKDFSDIRAFYSQAQRALNLGRILLPESQIHFFDDFVLYDIIQQLPPMSLASYVHPDVQKLEDYDEKNHTSLCKTLLSYLNHDKSLTRTAQTLYVHKNTVNYRIRQCSELLNTSFKAENKNFIYVFSLSILHYLRQFSLTHGENP